MRARLGRRQSPRRDDPGHAGISGGIYWMVMRRAEVAAFLGRVSSRTPSV